MFNVIDDYHRESLGIDVNLSLPSSRVTRTVDKTIVWRNKLRVIRFDYGSEYIRETLPE